MSSKISLCYSNTGHLGLRNETKLVLSSIVIIGLLGFNQVPNSIQYAYACEEGDIQHWTNLRAQANVPIQHSTEPTFTGLFLLPIPTMIPQLLNEDSLTQDIADRLNALEYFVDDSGVRLVESGDVSSELADVLLHGYSTICKNGIMQVVGGLLIQPDTATLVLAYGIANSIWIVPSVAGIGIAVYLVKRKI